MIFHEAVFDKPLNVFFEVLVEIVFRVWNGIAQRKSTGAEINTNIVVVSHFIQSLVLLAFWNGAFCESCGVADYLDDLVLTKEIVFGSSGFVPKFNRENAIGITEPESGVQARDVMPMFEEVGWILDGELQRFLDECRGIKDRENTFGNERSERTLFKGIEIRAVKSTAIQDYACMFQFSHDLVRAC